MLKLRRHDGSFVKLTHKSGDEIELRFTFRHYPGGYRDLIVLFDDPPRNFEISRPKADAPECDG